MKIFPKSQNKMTKTEIRVADRKQQYSYRGAIHIHSSVSDGTGSLNQIVDAGLKAGLDYLIITDHNSLKLKNDGKEGWYDNRLFVLIGEEVSHSDQHLLALGIDREIPEDLRPEQSSDEIQKNGGVGIVAHPDGVFRFHLRNRNYRWKNWDLNGINGVEIWSYMFDWVKDIKYWNLPYYYFYPDQAITGPQNITLTRWDELNKDKRIVGIGAIDAHAKGFWPFQVFPYFQLFKTVVTYIQTPDKLPGKNSIAKDMILDKIRTGKCYFAYEQHAKAENFHFWLETTAGILEMGDRESIDSEAVLYLNLPQRSSFKILKNGKPIFSGIGKSWNMTVSEPGVFRVEAYMNKKPWIYSNPIVITSEDHES